jgi:3-hydroxyisobutyrate dehydrogenase/2-hydroxy-3-oxopropionate reductase
VHNGGAHLLDTPVSGSVALAERGELTVLVGGEVAALDRARPILGAFGSRIVHLGGPGAGATMKLVVNSVLHGLNQAVAEALVLAERAGVDRAAAYDVLAASAIAAPFVHYKRDAYVHPETAAVAFTLMLGAKDLRLIGDLAHRVGARCLSSPRTRHWRAGSRPRLASDLSALADLLRTSAG